MHLHEIRVAVAGTGFIGPVHIEALRRLGVQVVGILGSSPEKSTAAAEQMGIPSGYASFDDLLADDVAAVHIATPNKLHYEMATAAMRAGKHVMVEKPLAMNSTESAELVELASECGVVAGVNYNIRYYPLCLEAAQQFRSGELGRLFHVTGSYVQDWLFHPTDFNWRVLAEEGGALRAVADIGTHWLDLIHAITGLEVEAVCADLQTVYEERKLPASGKAETFTSGQQAADDWQSIKIDTEDYGCIMLRFAGGGHGCVHVSQVTAGRKNCLQFELAGEKGSLAFNSERPNELWMGHRDSSSELLIRDPALLTDRAAASCSYPGGHNEGFGDTFKQCFREFYQYIAAGDMSAKPGFPTLADGHREIRICEAILASGQRGEWVTL